LREADRETGVIAAVNREARAGRQRALMHVNVH
jgi:hypothetical protein